MVPRNQSRLIREVPLSDRHNYLSRMTMRADLMQPSWFSDPRSQRITTAFFSVVDSLDISDAQRLFRTASASVHEAMVCMGQYHRKPLWVNDSSKIHRQLI